ncbi:MAG: hypothetical protein KME55_40620 [Nostoc indistinguendum CM1-VF10]|nr:hypothetical protein [Nostoc indistinguendum CM1-VF10]
MNTYTVQVAYLIYPKHDKFVIDHGAIANYRKGKPIDIKELEVKRSRHQTDSIWEIQTV